MTPNIIAAIVTLVVGLAIVVISFFYRRRQEGE